MRRFSTFENRFAVGDEVKKPILLNDRGGIDVDFIKDPNLFIEGLKILFIITSVGGEYIESARYDLTIKRLAFIIMV